MVNFILEMKGDKAFIDQIHKAYNNSGLIRQKDLDEQDNVPLPNSVALTGSKNQVAKFIKKIPGENIRLIMHIESSEKMDTKSNFTG